MDLSQFAVDSLVVAAVFILMNLLGKPLIEAFLKPDAPAHDVAVQAVAVLLGVVGIFLDHGFPATSDGHSWLLLVVSGILSGASAIGVYHVTKTSTGGANSTGTAVLTAADLATAVAAALAPVLAKLAAPATPHPDHTFAYTFPPVPAPEPAIETAVTLPPAVAPPSPAPGPAAPAAPPA